MRNVIIQLEGNFPTCSIDNGPSQRVSENPSILSDRRVPVLLCMTDEGAMQDFLRALQEHTEQLKDKGALVDAVQIADPYAVRLLLPFYREDALRRSIAIFRSKRDEDVLPSLRWIEGRYRDIPTALLTDVLFAGNFYPEQQGIRANIEKTFGIGTLLYTFVIPHLYRGYRSLGAGIHSTEPRAQAVLAAMENRP